MKVKIGNKIYDSKDKPIMLIFSDDDMRKNVAQHLTDMPEKEGIRKYAIFNNEHPKEEIDKFMDLKNNDEL